MSTTDSTFKRRTSRIKEREDEIRRRQPKVQKMIMRSRCILSESATLGLEERVIVAKNLESIAKILKQPIIQASC